MIQAIVYCLESHAENSVLHDAFLVLQIKEVLLTLDHIIMLNLNQPPLPHSMATIHSNSICV